MTTEETGAFFFVDSTGERQDAGLHEKILSAGDRKFKRSEAYQDTIRYAVEKLGLSEEEAKEVFG